MNIERHYVPFIQRPIYALLQLQQLKRNVNLQVLLERLKRAAAQKTALLDKLERARDENDDLKFQVQSMPLMPQCHNATRFAASTQKTILFMKK